MIDLQLPFKIGDTIYMIESDFVHSPDNYPNYKIVSHDVASIIIDKDYEVYPAESTWDGYFPVSEMYYDPEQKKMVDSPYITQRHHANNMMTSMKQAWADKKDECWLGLDNILG